MAINSRLDRFEKNYFINGAMDFFQRSGISTIAVSNSGGGTYITADRWRLRYQGTWNVAPNSTISSSVPTGSVAENSNSIVGDPGEAAAVLTHFQLIESIYARELAGETVSMSCWVRSESARDMRLVIDVPDVKDDYAAVTSFLDTTQTEVLTVGSWTLVKFENITLPATTVRGVRVGLLMTNMSVTGSSVEHNMTMCMLNKGPQALPFTRAGRNIAEELQFCQRYYEKSYDINVTPGTTAENGMTGLIHAETTVFANCETSFKVVKRANPTSSVYSRNGTLGALTNDSNSTDAGTGFVIIPGTKNFQILNGSSGLVAGEFYRCHWTAESEL